MENAYLSKIFDKNAKFIKLITNAQIEKDILASNVQAENQKSMAQTDLEYLKFSHYGNSQKQSESRDART